MLFFSAVICITSANSINDSIFNNFLVDVYDMSAGMRGFLEFPRELPGLLVVLMTGVLCMLSITHLGVVGAAILTCGLACLGLFGQSFVPMLFAMVIGSAGLHLLQPVDVSIAIGLSKEGGRGRRMGQHQAIATFGAILGSGGVWLLFDRANPQYRTAFLCASIMACIGACIYACMNIPHLRQPRARLVVMRKYRLYYMLELLFGARKQVFITFGPWVLIQEYGQTAKGIAGLLMIAAFLGLAVKPLVGIIIDHIGERAVMIFDGLSTSVVCLGYGYAGWLMGSNEQALYLASACYVLDNLLFCLGTGRAVYVSRIASSPQEITSTVSMGISINHVASMIIPCIAGALWSVLGYERLFLSAGFLALVTAAVAWQVPGRKNASSSA